MHLGKLQRIYLATALLWLVAVAAYGVWHVYSVLSGPPGPDVYANRVGFQIIAYVLVWLPRFLPVLVGVLLVEFVLFGRKTRSPVRGGKEQ